MGKLSGQEFMLADYLPDLPVFQPGRDQPPVPEPVLRWRADTARSQAIVFCTPAYLENVPAVLKNALEWVTASGELDHKPALVFTFAPAPPRGERARQSLLWSLAALNVRVIAEAALYQQEVSYGKDGIEDADSKALITEALRLLVG